jgi:hypothetical protein
MHLMATLKESSPDPTIYQPAGEAVCSVCAVRYFLHVRVQDGVSPARLAEALLKFHDFLAASAMHDRRHLEMIPMVVGLDSA